MFFISEGEIDYPRNLIISSKGPAAAEQSLYMGQYVKINGEMMNGRPIWKKLGDDINKSKLFYSGMHFMSKKMSNTYKKGSTGQAKNSEKPTTFAHPCNKLTIQRKKKGVNRPAKGCCPGT